jgi:predicted  nucleic acid-binding Zn-ribbon protein
MADEADVRAALGRLAGAMDDLEAAVHRQAQRGRRVTDLAQELALMRADRQKLAERLDEMTARAQAQEQASRQVSERVERAIGAIRSVVEAPAET